ncbi:transcription factor Adf-1-like [Tachysurus fulvidraco]|uniref:transcription factor Adf-1-like n=1 Tax=Tachysurus fulvidraco TaxID=1234273 RepID=UPI000F5039D2|nr:transcription factor Adf-1-like [Tachysurus fulvidraco]
MGQFEDQLSEEVRRYKHLYDPSSKHYKQGDVMLKSWKEIGQRLGEDPEVCMKKWKAIRDKFVRLKKRLKNRNCDSGPDEEKEPEYCMRLSWLNGFIKHRDARNDLVPKSEAGEWRRSSVQQATCSDDDDDSACTEVTSVSQPVKKRKRLSKGEDIVDKISTLRQEMVNCTTLVSQLSAITESRRCSDEFFTFAQAVADSLRKLPPERVEATKVKLFTVLGDAHNAAGL